MKLALLPYFKKGQIEVGVDEAGRGCLAGPVVAAAVILPKDFNHPLLNDSKKLTEKVTLAENILRQLEEKLSGLAAEIQDERLRSGVLTYGDAVRHQSLDNRLKLAQQLVSYIEQLKNKIDTFRDGGRQLSFLYQEATDDLKIIQTLSHLRLDDFLVRSDRVIGYLKGELKQHLIRADGIRYAHTSSTWEAVITRN